MLEFTGEGKAHDCSGMTRRDFLHVGTLGAISLSLPAYLAAKEHGAVRPGHDAQLGLSPLGDGAVGPDVSFIEILKGMVPQNIFAALTDNSAMLQLIFFALLFGFFTVNPEAMRSLM